jgi:hypothetical protein
MAQFTGMDIEAVRSLGNTMKMKAAEIRTIMGQLSSSLEGTPWVGNDREKFLSEWQGTHCQQLNAVITGLEDASTKAITNAGEQETASA